MAANVLAIPFRTAEGIPSLASSIVTHVCEADAAIHPEAITPDAEGLAEQRKKLFADGAALVVSEAGLDALVGYFEQLSYTVTKLPDDVSVAFPWHPIFASSNASILGSFPTPEPVALNSLQYERLSVLFNIAAMHSALGVQAKRTTEEGIKTALMAFQKAAGALTQLITLLPLLPTSDSTPNPVSPEFAPKALEALRDLCLAQAQEVFWQKAVMDRLKNGTIAKLAAKASEYYESAHTSAVEAKGDPESWPAFAFPTVILTHLKLKQLHFAAVAQFRKSIDDLGANRYGDELGRLAVAEAYVKKAMEAQRRGVADTVIRDLKGLQATLAENMTRAEKDNRLIYLEHPTPLSSLPPIVPASMVKPITMPALSAPLDNLRFRPFFETLVPKEVSLAIRLYQDRKERFGKEEMLDKGNNLDASANKFVPLAFNFPMHLALKALLQPVGLPPSLLAKAREVKQSGGVEKILGMMKDVRKVSSVNSSILNETLQTLAAEEAEDTQHRQQLGTDRWTRPPSSSVNGHLTSRAESLAQTLRAAGNSDGVVRAKFAEWEQRITVLGGDEAAIERSIPSLAAPSLMSTQSTVLTNLRSALHQLEDLRTSRHKLIDSARHALASDDGREAIMRRARGLKESGKEVKAEEFEEVFETEMGKFAVYKRAMDKAEGEQEDALDRIKTANATFLNSRKTDSVVLAREAALQGLDTAFHKYRELVTNLQEGLKFYSEIARLLSELRDGCKQWAYARSVESRDQLQALTSGLGRLNVDPGAYDPNQHGPIRFG